MVGSDVLIGGDLPVRAEWHTARTLFLGTGGARFATGSDVVRISRALALAADDQVTGIEDFRPWLLEAYASGEADTAGPWEIARGVVADHQKIDCGPISLNPATTDAARCWRDLVRNRETWTEYRHMVRMWNTDLVSSKRERTPREFCDFTLWPKWTG